jgi:hypothetical protein
LIDVAASPELEAERNAIIQEADELTRIFGAIFRKKTKT